MSEPVTLAQMVAFGGAAFSLILGALAFFLRRLISDHDSTKDKLDTDGDEINRKLQALEQQLSEMRLTFERNFVSYDAFEKMQDEIRGNFRILFDGATRSNDILSRLDERSKSDDRLFQTVQTMMESQGRRS